MAKGRVLDVGNCDPDHGAIRAMLVNHFDVQVDRVMFVPEALAAIDGARYDLVLVNRVIFADDSDGLALIRALRPRPEPKPPVMLISNFGTAQEQAIAAGACPGFGKSAVNDAETIDRLSEMLPSKATH